MEERLLVKRGFPRWDGGRVTGVGQADKGKLAGKCVLSRCQDDPEVAVLAPATGNINQHRGRSEEKMSVLNGFPVYLGRVWDRKIPVMASTNWACVVFFSSL